MCIRDSFEDEEKGSDIKILAAQRFEELATGLNDIIKPINERGLLPYVILCGSSSYRNLQNFLNDAHFDISIMRFEELSKNVNLEPVAVWKV